MPLALEHWPTQLRGVISGLLQGGYYWGYMLAAVVFGALYPMVRNSQTGESWRVFFWIGGLPALLGIYVLTRVEESPVWMARRSRLKKGNQQEGLSLVRILRKDLIGTTVHTAILMTVLMFSYYSLAFWYPTFLRELGFSPLLYVVALNAGAVAGTALWGRVSDTKLGRRGTVAMTALFSLFLIPLYVKTHSSQWLLIGAVLMGINGVGIWGMVPSYLTERFPTAARGVGPALAYNFGALAGSLTPALIGGLQDRGMSLPNAMAVCMAVSSLLVATIIWLGPETRGRTFTPLD
jgi:SHS family lactate transporter-like MFS transporter